MGDIGKILEMTPPWYRAAWSHGCCVENGIEKFMDATIRIPFRKTSLESLDGTFNEYKIMFFHGMDGVSITKPKGKCLNYYGFSVGKVRECMLPMDYRGEPYSYENFHKKVKSPDEVSKIWFWKDIATWEDFESEEVRKALIERDWHKYARNSLNFSNFDDYGKAVYLATMDAFKARLIRCFEKNMPEMLEGVKTDVPKIDFEYFENAWKEDLERRKRYLEKALSHRSR